MSDDPSWNLNDTARGEVAGCRLEKEEWFLRSDIFELLDMICVVTTYCNYLFWDQAWMRTGESVESNQLSCHSERKMRPL